MIDWIDDHLGWFIGAFCVLALAAVGIGIGFAVTSDDHKGEHCTNHILIPMTSGKVTTLMPECTQWEKNAK